MADDPTNAETSAQSDNNSKKVTNNRKKCKRNNEGRYMCDYCDKDYSQTHNLRKHIANNHKNKSHSPLILLYLALNKHKIDIPFSLLICVFYLHYVNMLQIIMKVGTPET